MAPDTFIATWNSEVVSKLRPDRLKSQVIMKVCAMTSIDHGQKGTDDIAIGPCLTKKIGRRHATDMVPTIMLAKRGWYRAWIRVSANPRHPISSQGLARSDRTPKIRISTADN